MYVCMYVHILILLKITFFFDGFPYFRLDTISFFCRPAPISFYKGLVWKIFRYEDRKGQILTVSRETQSCMYTLVFCRNSFVQTTIFHRAFFAKPTTGSDRSAFLPLAKREYKRHKTATEVSCRYTENV